MHLDSLWQSQTFFFMYRNINVDVCGNIFFVCAILKVISRSNRGQIIEK